jgi:hypothetical protein
LDTNKGQSVAKKRISEDHLRPESSTSASRTQKKINFSPLSLALLKHCERFEKYFYRTDVQRTTDTELTGNTTNKQDALQLVKKNNLWEVNKDDAGRSR